MDSGLRVELSHGDKCPGNPAKNYTLSWEIKCDKGEDAKGGELIIEDSSQLNNIDTTCDAIIKAKSIEACPKFSFNKIFKFLNDNATISGCILIFIGILEAFLGYKLIKVTIFLMGIVSVTTFITVVMFQFFLPSTATASGSNTILYVVLSFGLLLGIILGFVMSYYKKLFFGILGGVLGYVVGNLLYITLTRLIDVNPIVVYWVTLVVCIIIFCLLTVFFHKYLVIIATSVIGSYGVIRGFSVIFGGYPDESIIIDIIERGEKEQLKELFTVYFIIYLVCLLLLIIGSIVVQLSINKDEDEQNDEKEELLDQTMSSRTSKGGKNTDKKGSIWDNIKD